MNNAIPEGRLCNTITGELAQVGPVRGELRIAQAKLLAEEKDLIHLPDELTYADGAQVACGFGTVYVGLEKIGISGNDALDSLG